MSKLAWAGELQLIGASWTDKDGHMVKLKIVSPNEEKPNPFKAFTKRKGNRGGTRFHASVAHVQGLRDREVCYDGQFMLAGWQDSSTNGYTVTFWCEPPDDHRVHVFDGFRRGVDTFMVALVELSDDEQPVDQKKRARVEGTDWSEDEHKEVEQKAERRGQLLSQVAAMMCNYPMFAQWIREEHRIECASPDDCAKWMRGHLKIESRRALDNDEEVAGRFHATIRRPFVEWQDSSPSTRRVPAAW